MTEPVSALSAQYFADIRTVFLAQRQAAEKAIDQLSSEDLFQAAGADDNSIAVLLKHVGGNLRSRWTRPFDTDGEKPDRDRDTEFETEQDTPDSVRAIWDQGWSVLEATLSALQPSDIERVVRIRGEEIALMAALHRSLAHTAQHVGQIILLAKHQRGGDWRTLSIPRGESARYLRQPPA
jgi:hypothetical protein